MSSQDKELRFKPDHEGMLKFLQEFKQIWDILMLLARGPVGQTPEIQRFIHRKEQITRFARLIIEGKLDSFVRTLTAGSHLIDNIEDYIELIIQSNRVAQYFDSSMEKMKILSPSVWQRHVESLNKLYAVFAQADRGEESDLREVILAYNTLVSEVERVMGIASADKRQKDEQTEREKRIREKRERSERARDASRELLAQLG